MQVTGAQLDSKQSSSTIRDESRGWTIQLQCSISWAGSEHSVETTIIACMQVTGAQPYSKQLSSAIRDESRVWETIAAAQYKLDGDDAGWDSEESDQETEDDKYIKVRPMACCTA